MSDDQNANILRAMQRKTKENRFCFECGERGPSYVCLNFNTFVCTSCSGILREFSYRVKGISMSTFTDEEMAQIRDGGNAKARSIWLAKHKSKDFPEPTPGQRDAIRKFIMYKYQDKRWYKSSGSKKKKQVISESESEESSSSSSSDSDDSEEERRRAEAKARKKAAKKAAKKELKKSKKTKKKSKAASDSSSSESEDETETSFRAPPTRDIKDIMPNAPKLVIGGPSSSGATGVRAPTAALSKPPATQRSDAEIFGFDLFAAPSGGPRALPRSFARSDDPQTMPTSAPVPVQAAMPVSSAEAEVDFGDWDAFEEAPSATSQVHPSAPPQQHPAQETSRQVPANSFSSAGSDFGDFAEAFPTQQPSQVMHSQVQGSQTNDFFSMPQQQQQQQQQQSQHSGQLGYAQPSVGDSTFMNGANGNSAHRNDSANGTTVLDDPFAALTFEATSSMAPSKPQAHLTQQYPHHPEVHHTSAPQVLHQQFGYQSQHVPEQQGFQTSQGGHMPRRNSDASFGSFGNVSSSSNIHPQAEVAHPSQHIVASSAEFSFDEFAPAAQSIPQSSEWIQNGGAHMQQPLQQQPLHHQPLQQQPPQQQQPSQLSRKDSESSFGSFGEAAFTPAPPKQEDSKTNTPQYDFFGMPQQQQQQQQAGSQFPGMQSQQDPTASYGFPQNGNNMQIPQQQPQQMHFQAQPQQQQQQFDFFSESAKPQASSQSANKPPEGNPFDLF